MHTHRSGAVICMAGCRHVFKAVHSSRASSCSRSCYRAAAQAMSAPVGLSGEGCAKLFPSDERPLLPGKATPDRSLRRGCREEARGRGGLAGEQHEREGEGQCVRAGS